MPRDGSGVYTIPAGTEGIPDQTIESPKYNAFAHDVQYDLNWPRPIIAGGTGASNVNQALQSLGAEKSTQFVSDNYDSFLFYPGSFYSAGGSGGATNAPVAGHAFVGIAISSDPPAYPPANQNLVLIAHDQSDTVTPGRTYIREKKAGVWGAWTSSLNSITLLGDPQAPTPASDDNDESVATTRFVKNVAVLLAGSVMTGPLTLNAAPDADLKAATKKYVDDKVAAGVASIIVFPAGTQMLFCQNTAPTGWTRVTGYSDRVLRITDGTIGTGGTTGLSGIISQTATGSHVLSWNEMAAHVHAAYIWDNGHAHNASVALTSTLSGIPAGGATQAGGSTPVTVDAAATGVHVWDGATWDQTASAGSNWGHTHPINLSIAYLDVMLAVKN